MPLNRSAKGRKPQYFEDPATDKLLDMVVKLTAELSVTRDRLDSLVRLMARRNMGITPADLEQFEESTADGQERSDARRQLIAQVLQVIDDEVEEASKPNSPPSLAELRAELDQQGK